MGQPEIVEKSRACEAYGAEVIKLTVGPELFYVLLRTLEDTGYFNASLYTPYGIAGIETLGAEIGHEVQQRYGRQPDAVVVTNAGGGNITGTARGLRKVGCDETEVVAVSVDLTGLHMASDHDFNNKSFTTGHTGFGVPFATWPDRVDVPRNAARPLRYMNGYHLVSQGEVFYMTELLTKIEGLERGPAGNTSLTAAVAMARQMIATRSSSSRRPSTPAPESTTTASCPSPARAVSRSAVATLPATSPARPSSFRNASTKSAPVPSTSTSCVAATCAMPAR